MNVSRRTVLTAVAVIGVAILAIVAAPGRRAGPPGPLRLEIEAQISAGTYAQLFWSDTPAFSNDRSALASLQPTGGGTQILRFALPSRGVHWLRFDPTDVQAEILIGDVTLFDARGARLGALDFAALQAVHQIASIQRIGRFTRIVTEPPGNDPYLLGPAGCLFPPLGGERFLQVTPLSAAVVSALLIALLAASVSCVLLAAFGRRPALAAGHDANTRQAAALWTATIFVGVFAARLLLMRQYPLTVPYLDQWDAEARAVFIPFEACGLSWGQMFYLHNEHRVFFTKLLALDLLRLNGQWDPRLQQVMNGAMQSLTAVLAVLMLWIAGGRRRISSLAVLIAATFALPFAWENTLQPFQSAFFFLELFSVLAIWLTTTHRAGSVQWYLGWLCAGFSLVTAAGGLLTPVAIVAAAVFQYWADRRRLRDLLTTVAASAVVFAPGIYFLSPSLEHHGGLNAQTLGDFAAALGHSLAWPWTGRSELSLLLWAPVLSLLLRRFRQRQADAADALVIGLASWVVLQAMAIAYGRGAGGGAPASRYQDVLSLGLAVNTFVLLLLRDRQKGRAGVWLMTGVSIGWALISAAGIDRRVETGLADLSGLVQRWGMQETALRRYISTGDPAELSSRPIDQLPYPVPTLLASVAGNPTIRRILPASVREPLRVTPRTVTDEAFVIDGVDPMTPRDPLIRSWGSLTAKGSASQGRFESEPLPACRIGRRLDFQVAGHLGAATQKLWLRPLNGQRDVIVSIREPAKEGWTHTTVPCPDGPFEVIGVDAGPDWFGFREPVEIGSASVVAETLIDLSPRLLLLAFALAAFAARRA